MTRFSNILSAGRSHLRATRLGAALLVAGCLLSVAPRAHAATLDDANRAFAEGRYSVAAAAFDELVHEQGYSAPLLFDLGNAYLRAGRPADAIVAYERAKVLSPRDREITENLA